MTLPFRALVFVVLASTCLADSVIYMRVHRPLIEEQVKLSPAEPAARIHTLRGLFQKGGCPQVIEQEVPAQDFPNVMCILPGKEEGTIVAGASIDYPLMDTQDPGGWGALTALPLLAESLSLVPHRFTIMLIAFTGHQKGTNGATWYASQLTASQKKNIRAMINLEDLGKNLPVFALAQPGNGLGEWLQAAARSLRLPTPAQMDASTTLPAQGALAIKNDAVPADAKAFQEIQVPAINIQSATSAVLPVSQANGLVPEKIIPSSFDMDAYEKTYQMLCVYVLYLDSNLGKPLVRPGVYSGKIIDTARVFPTSPMDVSVKIDRFNTTGELNRYETILEKGGQEGLADALSDENEKGDFRFGLNLAFAVKIIALQNSGKTPCIWLVAPRVKGRGSISTDYRFTVIKLTLDAKGTGEGLYYSTAKLRFNKQHELIIDDFGSKPDNVVQVRLDQPALPIPSPATSLSAAAKAPKGNGSPSMPGPSASSAAPASASTANPTSSPPVANSDASATFHTKAQLVQVDVAVTNSQGQPVPGLKQSDFVVFEDGKPQEIRAFDAHIPIAHHAEVEALSTTILPPTPIRTASLSRLKTR